jgi:hypothetical protein
VPQENQKVYIQKVLKLYQRLPGTPARPRRADRQLAAELHCRGVPLDVVEIALRLATARRNARPPNADPLPPVRSLHYFLPVIDEMPKGEPPEGYLDYLRDVVSDKQPATNPVTSPDARRPTRPRRCTPRQLRLPFDPGAGPKNDVSS